jgi:hypothetical protein
LRVSIIVSDDDGNSYSGEVELKPKKGKKQPEPKQKKHGVRDAPAVNRAPINFATPIRAFVKLHARNLTGAQKFALLVAYLTRGDGQKEIQMTEVENNWNRMKPLLGGKFNLAYTTRAKDNGWVDSPKRGIYKILPDWKGIFDAA